LLFGFWLGTSTTISSTQLSLRRRLKIPHSEKLYGLRHSFITELLLSGSNLATASILAGHAALKMTTLGAGDGAFAGRGHPGISAASS
jgi:hypothetical protein